MIRILHILNSMGRGGAESFIMNAYRKVDRDNFQFDFLLHKKSVDGYEEEILQLGGRIYYVTPRNKGVVRNYKSIKQFFNEHNEYEIIHNHMSSLSYITPLIVGKECAIPIRIAHSHSTKAEDSIIHKILHYLNRLIIKNYATHYFACSNNASEWLFGEKKHKSGEVIIINNGIDYDKFRFNEKVRNSIRHEFGYFNTDYVIGHVGRFTEAKNHEFIIRIFEKLVAKIPNAKLILIGDGELKHEIINLINIKGLEKHVVLTGVRNDVHELIQAIDLMLFPSKFEGLPVTLIESQISGLPCVISNNITTDVSISELVLFLDLNDEVDIWVESIIKQISSNILKRKENKIKSNEYDINIIVTELTDHYRNFVDKSILSK